MRNSYPPNSCSPNSSSNVIAIVDDDEDVRDVLAALFEFSGHEVKTFDSGTAFLEESAFEHFACLVADLRMPGMSGLELFTELGNRGVTIPTMLITGESSADLRRRAASSGIMTVMQKPMSHRQLLRFASNSVQ